MYLVPCSGFVVRSLLILGEVIMTNRYNRFIGTVGTGLCFLIALSACTSVSLDDENKNKIESRTGGSTGQSAAGGSSGGSSSGGQTLSPLESKTAVTPVQAQDPLNDANNPLSKRSVYFDYDSFVLKDEFKATVEAHARYLNANKTKKVVVQGNTDERGGREYNLALGQKRAEVVRKALLALGVTDAQIESISFGEEKPKATGTDEASMSENRRADLAY
jgi:peptidoglycan-associated lipoprotein